MNMQALHSMTAKCIEIEEELGERKRVDVWVCSVKFWSVDNSVIGSVCGLLFRPREKELQADSSCHQGRAGIHTDCPPDNVRQLQPLNLNLHANCQSAIELQCTAV